MEYLIKNVFSQKVAESIINEYKGRYSDLFQSSELELQSIKGIGPKLSKKIVSTFQLIYLLSNNEGHQKITSSKIAFDAIKSLYVPEMYSREHFCVLYLRQNNVIIKKEKISSGSYVASIVPSQYIIKQALLLKAMGIIISHNHPSGNIMPSDYDKQVTSRLKEMCSLFDMTLLDSLVITPNTYYSFADEGLL